ncbi:MAG TPA: MFS transporter, partial [Actinobacteria bacterium]|nr:MFS transporter [Actinomycetota bacterium]
MRHVPESRDLAARGRFDLAGAGFCALALGGITYALIEAPELAGHPAGPVLAAVIGVGAAASFIWLERRRTYAPGAVAPMLPVDVFGSRQFTVVNVITFLVYGAFGGMIFLLILQLQVVSGFSPLAAGTALLPTTVLMLLLSARAGALAQRAGPRWLMTGGCTGCAAGVLLMTRIGPHASYLTDVLPAVVVFGLGLSMTVAPLTATVLASADVRHAGVASGVNNAVARAAGLLAVAGLPAAAGLGAASYHSAARFAAGFDKAMIGCAAVLLTAAVLSGLLIDSNVLRGGPAGQRVAMPECRVNCPLGGPPLEPDQDDVAAARALPSAVADRRGGADR